MSEEKINYIENSQPLKTIDKKILYELSKPEIINKKVQVCYKSPEFGEEKIYIVPKKIIYDNEKVYLWCYNFKYEGLGLLNIERILKINSIDILKNINIFNHYNVVYELTGEAVNSFEPKDYETILVKSDDKIKVNAKIENEFLFIQRLLQFGTDFKVISPDFFREILINKIKLIQKGYIND